MDALALYTRLVWVLSVACVPLLIYCFLSLIAVQIHAAMLYGIFCVYFFDNVQCITCLRERWRSYRFVGVIYVSIYFLNALNASVDSNTTLSPSFSSPMAFSLAA